MADRILIVEDESAIADNIVYALETEGFRTHWVQFGGRALEVVRGGDVALIVLDVGLPDGNGFEVCKSIRAFSEVPIVFLTARDAEIDRVVGLEIGGDDYVVKPFSPRELTARVKSILRRTGTVVGPTTAAGPTDFARDAAGKRILFRDEELELTKSEFLILDALLDAPGRVFSRRQILDTAWDEPGMSTERAVDTHVKTLRAKLRAVDPAKEPIRTHRGLGYSLTGTVREL